ncbi:MAG: GNAT family N-acetyltransferase [Suilimivivens sp.]
MKKKEPMIKTKRMIIQPMTDEEIEKLIETSDSEEMKKAYGEMLDGCKADPENRIWYAPWQMSLKSDPTYIGDLGFKGPARENAVEIGYGILPEYEGKGYTTEAVQGMVQWAFGNEGVVFVEAETDPGNKASQRILEKCGFIPDGEGKEGPRFVLESPLTSWMAIYMLFGLSIGTALGSSFSSVGIGTAMGLCIGLAVGVALDSSAKKEREKLREKRRDKNRN